MDFLVTNEQFEQQISSFCDSMKEHSYSESTLRGYMSFLSGAWKRMKEVKNTEYTIIISEEFIKDILPSLSYSDSYKNHTRTALRRFNDYLFGRPFIYRQRAGGLQVPEPFHEVMDEFLDSMEEKGMRLATIETRGIFATQFLRAIDKQGIHSVKDIEAVNIGAALLSVNSIQGFCEKLPSFLKYLYEKRMTTTDLSKTVPYFLPEVKLPTVYTKLELQKILNDIARDSLVGKRDYSIMMMFVAYGIRVTDLINLKIGDIDFQHNCFSFTQSKTGSIYNAELLPTVREALIDYLAELKEVTCDNTLFRRITAPFGAMTRNGVYNIVASRLKYSVDINNRKKGSHAIRSSMASALITDEVPYTIVQKILGHKDPNATKRYAMIDLEKLRRCAIECPEATGCFASYLEGCDWK